MRALFAGVLLGLGDVGVGTAVDIGSLIAAGAGVVVEVSRPVGSVVAAGADGGAGVGADAHREADAPL